MRRSLKRLLPDHSVIHGNRWFAPFANTLLHPRLWHLNRRSAAGAVAAGLFCGLIPGPFQMLGAAICAVIFRVNLPLAMLCTLYTNPFTIVPIYFAAFEIGKAVLGSTANFAPPPEMNDGLIGWLIHLARWVIGMGEPLAIGLVILACLFATLGYAAMRFGWRYWLIHALKKRAQKRNNAKRVN
jgi:uncharacterized protein (DUF2062 family)